MLSLCRLCHQDALPSAGRYKHNIYSSRPNSSPSSWKSLPSLAHGGVSPTTFPSSSWHRLPYHVCGCTLPCLVLFFFFFPRMYVFLSSTCGKDQRFPTIWLLPTALHTQVPHHESLSEGKYLPPGRTHWPKPESSTQTQNSKCVVEKIVSRSPRVMVMIMVSSSGSQPSLCL